MSRNSKPRSGPDGLEAARMLYAPPEEQSERNSPIPAATRAELAHAAAMLAGYLLVDYYDAVELGWRKGHAARRRGGDNNG